MVTRLILLIIMGFVAALYFPDSRRMIAEETRPVVEPVLVWSAGREIERVSEYVRREARDRYELPQTREWNAWLTTHFTANATTDPWGTLYAYRMWPDSFAILSEGPDSELGTSDDLRVSAHRPF